VGNFYEHGNETSGYIRTGNFLAFRETTKFGGKTCTM
jgi:hypothetical protein